MECYFYFILCSKAIELIKVFPFRFGYYASCRAALVDGTFWREDELPVLGLSARTAREMGHLPISGPAGSLEPLAELVKRGTRVIYVHLNNTNPVLIEDSPERAQVQARGLEVGADGLELEV